MMTSDHRKIPSFRGTDALAAYLGSIDADLPCDAEIESGPSAPLAQPLEVAGFTIGNRFAVNPMEGWDGERDGRPTANTTRRWQRFGASGAKLIWGGEAVAVRADGRANPNQLMLTAATQSSIAALRQALIASHIAACGTADGLVVGLQLTHSGRFCKPASHTHFEPRIAYRHPLLDRRFGQPDDAAVISDDELRRLVDAFVEAAVLARDCGFDFVDIKHCHGYLGHELLSAIERPGPYGGSLENRSRFLREIVAGIRARAPGLVIGVRLSATDTVPFRPDPARSQPGLPGPGIPEDMAGLLPYRFAFGADPADPVAMDLTETSALLEIFRELGISFVNLTAGSPYYTPHLIRPAIYPPSDGYQPPEEPLLGVARHLVMARMLKERFADITFVSSGLSYLQEFMPNVMQAAVRKGWTDSVGIGRLVLSYPELPLDVLAGKPLQRKRLCRTFSDCTTAPRNGIVSGCYPLDPHYKRSPEADMLAQMKENRRLGS
jgi:2,4-dienoyl-CoA reductase-like NADH-dependent reductase (Old Yellow Enzyme family)